MSENIYLAIDLKSFYASVECVDMGLDPLTAKLVVADESRTDKTICLAVSPKLKELGIPGRARLYEVKQKAQGIDFIIAKPRMFRYLEVSSKIVDIYLNYVAPEDLHIYSIDEVFMDVTPYLKAYKITPEKLAEKIIYDILKQTGITATAGIGTNLYLAKIAMDIKAKHMAPDKNGVRIASLDEISYRKELWNHKPLKDFWRIGPGYSRRLKELNINTMGELARYSLTGADNLYKKFGKLTELLIDHAWGYEPVEMKDIKAYRSENHSLSHGQVLSRPYKYNESILILREMIDELVEDLIIKHVQTDQIVLTIIYDVENTKKYEGKTEKDFYGRTIPKNSHGTVNLHAHTDSEAEISNKTLELFHKIVSPELTIRKIYIAANHIKGITEKKKARQMNLFTDYEELEKKETRERRKQNAIIKIKQRYGKNSIIRAMDLEEGATSIKRNSEVGGHRG